MKSRVEGSVVYFGTPGFCHHIVTASALTTELIDGVSGDVLFEYSQSRISRPRSWLQRFNIYKGLSEVLPIIQLILLVLIRSNLFQFHIWKVFLAQRDILSDDQARLIYLSELLGH